jgi:ABC-type uncharacterized transport system ATPase subunit
MAKFHAKSSSKALMMLLSTENVQSPIAFSEGSAAKVAPVPPIISILNLTKTYASGLQALKRIDLEIRKGEIFA